MTLSQKNLDRLLVRVIDWVLDGGDTWKINLDYWEIRRQLMNEGEQFEGPVGSALSNIDTAMDAYSPDPDRGPDQIDDRRLRQELELAFEKLRGLGYRIPGGDAT